MYEENLHITPDPKKGFPEPDVPADEAWDQMAGLLDTAMPVSPPGPPPPETSPLAGGNIIGGSSHIWGIVLGVLGLAGALTWGVLSLTNKTEESAITSDTVKTVQHITLTDSLTSINRNNSITQENVISPVNNDGQAEMKNFTENIPAGDKSGQPVPVSKPGNETKITQEPTPPVTVTDAPLQEAVKTADIEPAKPGTGNITTPVKDMPVREPANEDMLKDTVKITEFQPEPPLTVSDSVKSSGKTTADEKSPSNPADDGTPDGTEKPGGPGESKKSSGMSDNLTWQSGIYGSIGQVVQKGRDPNMFFGGMVTGGLWHKKLKGGIETGLGYEVYNDYGSVTENIRLTDSIHMDTLGNVQYSDTTHITAYNYQYQYLQVPLFVSKQVLTKGKFSLDLKTGPLLGILISERKALDYTSGPENGEILGTANSDYSRLKISWQWQVMAQFRWDFNERLSLSLSPYGIFYLNNIYDHKDRPPNMPYGIGLSGGLIYNFK